MSDQLLQATVSGLAVGATYSIIALGFVLVFAATRILNLAQGAFVVVGAYLASQFILWNLPFVLAVLAAAAICSILSVGFDQAVVRHVSRDNHFGAVMVTAGALFVAEAVVATVWGPDVRTLGDPWGLRTLTLGGVHVAVADIWIIALSTVLLVGTFLLLKRSRIGLATRAAVSDPVAATANGVSIVRTRLFVWGLAGAFGGIAGVMMSTGAYGLTPNLGIAAFAALPIMVLGGLDSPLGAIAGGLIIGLAQQLTALYQPEHLPFLGDSFSQVMPYVVLVIVLMVRPQGLFGRRKVQRF